MIPRTSKTLLHELARGYPAIAITGPRQSGKTTLARAAFGDRPYVSLENPDEIDFATSDPKGFLARFGEGAIFDEVQRCPRLFSYLQQMIDEGPKRCRFVLTGSQQFGLMSGITQSLAGRVANLTLLPFSYAEWYARESIPSPSLARVLFTGLYPPVLDRSLDPTTWYRNYIQNYVERDLRQLAAVGDLHLFQTFIRMCAARCGQLLNLSGLASDCGIAVNTAKKWISILEASYIIFLLRPHFANFGKRLIKTPKLYFYDTGLLAYLLTIHSEDVLETHAMRGPLFESFVVAETKKFNANRGLPDTIWFWRDRTGHEVDIVREEAGKLHAAECKSGQTITADALRGLLKWKEIAGTQAQTLSLVYGGEEEFTRQGIRVCPWRNVPAIMA